ncbi:MAG: beta-lactamase family protein [Alphaproteobacteria bacterium]|nr:beta-lactamase family protein [Alphaproteobacteria bacterium]
MNQARLRQQIIHSANETGFSGVINLAQNTQKIFNFCASHADRNKQQPNNIDTKFGLASITKFFTALVVLKYVERGIINLDTQLGDAINIALPNYAKTATFRHLLTHTSGIPDYYNEDLIADDGTFNLSIPWHDLRRPTDYIPILPNLPIEFKAGEKFHYNNSGYILLGIALETLSNNLFSHVIQTEILTPLNMHNTGFYAFDALPPNTAIGYIEQPDNTYQTNQNALPFIGASDGGIYSNIADLNKLWQGFWAGKIVLQSIINNIIHPHVSRSPDDQTKHYGLGIYINQQAKNTNRYLLIGGDAGVSTFSDYWQASKHQITILSNNAKGMWPLVEILQNHINNLQNYQE